MRPLGNGELRVGCVGLGAMPLSLPGCPAERQAVRVIHAALDAGMTLIDTADVYCVGDESYGENERLISKALAQWGENSSQIVVATKGGVERRRGAWTPNGHPSHLERACERSLGALGVEAITLYQLHVPDDAVPFADSVGALAGLRQRGKIRHVGLCNVTVAQIEEARKIVPVASVQNLCNVFDTTSLETGVLSCCEENSIAFVAHSPVGGHLGRDRVARDERLLAIAGTLGISPQQLCLAYLLRVSPRVVPIPGASRVESALASAAAARIEVPRDTVDALERAFPKLQTARP